MKKRQDLPAFLKLNYRYDINLIVKQFMELGYDDASKYSDLEAGGSMYENGCQYREEFLKNFLSEEEIAAQKNSTCLHGGNGYRQMALTEFNNEYLQISSAHTISSAIEKRATARQRLRRVSLDSVNYLPQADERNFNKRTKNVKGIFADILDSFVAPLARCRFALMQPGFCIKEHIDFNTDYAIRIHIPIITNAKCVIGVRYKGSIIERHLPADGSAWFINAGYPHWANNLGGSARVHLILTLAGQADLPLESPEFFFEKNQQLQK